MRTSLAGGTDLPHTPRLRQVLQGAHRMQDSIRKSQPRTRLPISLHLLRQLRCVVGTLRRLQGVCQVGGKYSLFFRFFPVRGDNNPTTVSVQLGRPSCLGGCGSGQSRSSDLRQGPLEAIEMRSVWKTGGCVRQFNWG